MTLHIVNRSPFRHTALAECLERTSSGDTILLTEDGVYGATQADWLSQLGDAGLAVYALEVDCVARGVIEQINPLVSVISDREFVRLTVEATNVVSWY